MTIHWFYPYVLLCGMVAMFYDRHEFKKDWTLIIIESKSGRNIILQISSCMQLCNFKTQTLEFFICKSENRQSHIWELHVFSINYLFQLTINWQLRTDQSVILVLDTCICYLLGNTCTNVAVSNCWFSKICNFYCCGYTNI